eukprot:1180789-Prorocentrum_minimum.AAC.1
MSEALTDTTMESSSRAYVRIGENERTNVILPTLLACERHGQIKIPIATMAGRNITKLIPLYRSAARMPFQAGAAAFRESHTEVLSETAGTMAGVGAKVGIACSAYFASQRLVLLTLVFAALTLIIAATLPQSSISQCLSRVFERDLGGCGFGPEGVFTVVPGLWTRVDTPPRRLKKSPLLFCAKRLFALGGCRCIRAKLRIAFGRVGCRCKSSRPPVWPPSRGRATQASTSCSSRWLPSEHKKKIVSNRDDSGPQGDEHCFVRHIGFNSTCFNPRFNNRFAVRRLMEKSGVLKNEMEHKTTLHIVAFDSCRLVRQRTLQPLRESSQDIYWSVVFAAYAGGRTPSRAGPLRLTLTRRWPTLLVD